MKENELYRALNASVTGCQPSDYWKNRMVRQIVKGEEMKKRTKVSFGVVIAVALLLISVAAVAVGVLVHEYYAKVADMEKEGVLERWQLEDKLQFIGTMKECNFEIDEELYATANDETLAKEEREAAADRIINNTYGEVIRESLYYNAPVEEDSLGLAPDTMLVFYERYLAEHPDWDESREGMQAYTDALGYYLRDEVGVESVPDTLPEKPVINEEYAVKALKDQMTDYWSWQWDAEAVEAMVPQVEWDETYRMWTVSGEVSDESMEKATDLRKDMNPARAGYTIEKTEGGYRASMLVDEYGHTRVEDLDKEAFRLEYLNWVEPVQKITMRQALDLAEAEVKTKYGVTEANLKEWFSDFIDLGTGEEDGLLYLIDFHKHYDVAVELQYGVVVNMATGRVEGSVSYLEKDRTLEWQLLEFAAETEHKSGWYINWSPEKKRELISKIRTCGLLPDHAYWWKPDPTEQETDAFAAEVFGAQGYVSTLNLKDMMRTLLGEKQDRSVENTILATRLLRKYNIHTDEDVKQRRQDGQEISAEEAEKIVRMEVCKAWEMPGNALDAWTAVTNLVQEQTLEDRPGLERKGGLIYYRVFLTRPDEELGQETFGRLDNMNFRVALDGTIMGSETDKGWRNPKEDRERWQK